MQKLRAYLFYLLLTLLAFACNKGPEKAEPKVYPANETIFNTFLFAEGSWWAYEDSNGNQDTFYIRNSSSKKRNVFEGNIHVYSDYNYNGKLIRTKNNKQFSLYYTSSLVHEYAGALRHLITVSSFQNDYGPADENLFYTPWPLNDSVPVGQTVGLPKKVSYLTILETGDTTIVQGKVHLGKYYNYKISSSVSNNLNDVKFLWQENVGLVEYNIDGNNYKLINYNLIKPLNK